MNREYQRICNKINLLLEENKQELRVIKRLPNYCELSNGLIFNTKELVDKFFREASGKPSKIAKAAGGSAATKTGKIGWKKGNIPWNNNTHGLVKIWNKGLNKNIDERLKKVSESRKGKNNPCHRMSDKSKESMKEKLSNKIKEKILNGEFTPNSNNRFTHFDVVFENKKYRSSWEVLFVSMNKNFEYEKLRIKYIGNDKKEHIYIVDFVDYDKKIAVEIKPNNLFKNTSSQCKKAVLEKWCKENEFKCIFIDEYWLQEKYKNIIDYSIYDNNTQIKLRKLMNEIN